MPTPRRLILSQSVQADMLAHAAAFPDLEVCGLLTGHGDDSIAVIAAHRVHNMADEPTRRFAVDPQAQFNILRAARDAGLRVVGHYHSHPNGAPEPSAYDLAMATDPEAVWCIVGLNPTVVRAFVCEDPVQGFRSLPIIDVA